MEFLPKTLHFDDLIGEHNLCKYYNFLVDNEKQTDEQTKSGLGWRNNLVGFQWHYMANSRIQTNLEVSRSTYNLNFLDRYSLYQKELELVNELSYSNGLSDDRITMDVDIILNKNNMLQVGTGFIRYTFEPFKQNYNTKNLISSFDTLLTTQGVTATESMVFAENKTYFKGGNVVYGMGIRYFNSDTFNYIRLQPKFILTQNINRYNNSEVIVGGDSGNIIFASVNNEIVLLGTWYLGGSSKNPGNNIGTSSYIPSNISTINSVMTSLAGSSYSLTQLDLSNLFRKIN